MRFLCGLKDRYMYVASQIMTEPHVQIWVSSIVTVYLRRVGKVMNESNIHFLV